MKSVQFPSWLMAAFAVASMVASATPLRGSTSIVRDGVQPKSTGCAIEPVSLLQIPGEDEIEDLQFDCEMDPEDADGKSGQVRTIVGPPAKMKALKEGFERGEFASGSRMNISKHVGKFGKSLILGDSFDPKTAIGKGNKGGQGRGQGRGQGQGGGAGRRRLGAHTGSRTYLVVKVHDVNNLARAETPAQIGDDVFGTLGDQVTLKSQMEACSMGQLTINPANNLPGLLVAPGVMETHIDIDITTAASRGDVRNAINAKVQAQLSAELGSCTLPCGYDQILYVLQGCYNDCGWAAYAYINSWNSVYQGNYYYMTGVLVHELGHNYGLAHSGGLNGATYTDHTCMMGNPLYSDDLGKMCYNAAKNWQLTWYDDRKLTVTPGGGSWYQDVTLVGIADYLNNPSQYPVTVKLETGTATDLFIGFNRATGVNAQNEEGDNQVTIVETGNNGDSYSQSYLKAKLDLDQNTPEATAYTIFNFGGVTGKNIIIEVIALDINANPGYATVRFRTDQAPTSSPTRNTICDSEPGTVLVKVEIKTDRYPAETSWTLKNMCTNTQTVSGGGFSSQETVQALYQDCVPAGEYTFTINDSYGDGICCSYGSGYYNIWHRGDLVKNGGQFGSSESTTFGQCGPTPTPPPITPQPTKQPITPPPTNKPTPNPTPVPTTPSPTSSPITPSPTNPPTPKPTPFPTPPPTPFPTNRPTPIPTPPPTQCIANGQGCNGAVEPCCSGLPCPSSGGPSSRVCPGVSPPTGGPPTCGAKNDYCTDFRPCCDGTCKSNGRCP